MMRKWMIPMNKMYNKNRIKVANKLQLLPKVKALSVLRKNQILIIQEIRNRINITQIRKLIIITRMSRIVSLINCENLYLHKQIKQLMI